MTELREETPPEGFERLVRIEDPESGLRGFICIHSTACGPAAGGCRMWPYDSPEAARRDVLRLAEGMTHKNALADIGLGGGKAVIIGDPATDKSAALLRAFGRAVEALGGQYYTAEDVGISTDDMAQAAMETPYAVGLGSGRYASGDPSPFTAEGVFQCMKAGADEVFGTDELTGRRVLVQGLGHVGMALAGKLHAAGAKLIVSDLDRAVLDRAMRDLGATICPPDAIFDQEMDIFAPCALGGILTHDTADKLTARLVCGAANNQLASAGVAETLRAAGIRYLPDYVVNAGGIISIAGEIHRSDDWNREARLTTISRRIRDILATSRTSGKTTIAVANDMVDGILAKAANDARREREGLE
ncbi:leucine dehydrogenase [Lutimaribacter pacificus]|uniref:Leucine dehydrogenase n=1 Tax=Lutimaribacter pacificus TaxID=391948 RepID=A0A1H0NQA5_9RHOB|nr:Glu/Leu/Phe/Val dehydrogenase dimerization domain-containing protein [Lutimaribacter pacificus]SDO94962.1 leucine dehydrogenase [Lutimaribacter pacificus]SHK96399.1 leucine dehydrogenase [Lutimaribacter pacificus]